MAVAIASATLTATAISPTAHADTSREYPSATVAGPTSALGGGYASALVGYAGAVPTAATSTPGSPGLLPMALAPGAPDPAKIPDLTFGVGSAVSSGLQAVGAAVDRAVLDTVNLSWLWQLLGYDPEAAINTALGDALTQALAGIPFDISSVPNVGPVLAPFFKAGNVTNVLALTELIGLNLADPLNLAGVPAPGLNIITAGPPFSLLRFLGIDLGWTPGSAGAVGEQVNNTPYLRVDGIETLITLRSRIKPNSLTNIGLIATLSGIILGLEQSGEDADVDVRFPLVAGFGLGAFAAGMSYLQVLEKLPQQPGGASAEGAGPSQGSYTVMPMFLVRNPGRANGGLFARFYPLAALLGLNTVTPDTETVSSIAPEDGTDGPKLSPGLNNGGANLLPVKFDATAEYDLLSDFPSWFNPVSLLNSGAALLFPTYMLRGDERLTALAELEERATEQLGDPHAEGATDSPAKNVYLTLAANALPLLEPIRLPIDLLNHVTGINFNNPLATALEPALRILTNLGYTDVDQANGYVRTLDQAAVLTPFGTLPSGVNWSRVPGDVFHALVGGIKQALKDGPVSRTPVDNPVRSLADPIAGPAQDAKTVKPSPVAADVVSDKTGGDTPDSATDATSTEVDDSTSATKYARAQDRMALKNSAVADSGKADRPATDGKGGQGGKGSAGSDEAGTGQSGADQAPRASKANSKRAEKDASGSGTDSARATRAASSD